MLPPRALTFHSAPEELVDKEKRGRRRIYELDPARQPDGRGDGSAEALQERWGCSGQDALARSSLL